jgi:hypothetical protein
VPGKYRRLTPDLRADHIATLGVLAHQVDTAPTSPLQWRKFFVVTVAALLG